MLLLKFVSIVIVAITLVFLKNCCCCSYHIFVTTVGFSFSIFVVVITLSFFSIVVVAITLIYFSIDVVIILVTCTFGTACVMPPTADRRCRKLPRSGTSA